MKKEIIILGVGALLAGAGLSGCGTTKALEQACSTGDWYQQGIVDGSRGHSNSAHYGPTCAKMGFAMDQSLYRRGVSEGLKSYCSYDNGYSMGNVGDRINQSCSGSLSYNYRRGHEDGVRARVEYERQESMKRACSYQRGYELGKAGLSPSELCTGSFSTEHYKGHRQGLSDRRKSN